MHGHTHMHPHMHTQYYALCTPCMYTVGSSDLPMQDQETCMLITGNMYTLSLEVFWLMSLSLHTYAPLNDNQWRWMLLKLILPAIHPSSPSITIVYYNCKYNNYKIFYKMCLHDQFQVSEASRSLQFSFHVYTNSYSHSQIVTIPIYLSCSHTTWPMEWQWWTWTCMLMQLMLLAYGVIRIHT